MKHLRNIVILVIVLCSIKHGNAQLAIKPMLASPMSYLGDQMGPGFGLELYFMNYTDGGLRPRYGLAYASYSTSGESITSTYTTQTYISEYYVSIDQSVLIEKHRLFGLTTGYDYDFLYDSDWGVYIGCLGTFGRESFDLEVTELSQLKRTETHAETFIVLAPTAGVECPVSDTFCLFAEANYGFHVLNEISGRRRSYLNIGIGGLIVF